MMEDVTIVQEGGRIRVDMPAVSCGYVDNLMRSDCFEELLDLYRFAHSPCKEISESMSALMHLEETIRRTKAQVPVYHIGDGAHCRTAALFAYRTKVRNISIDPDINEERCQSWADKWGTTRFEWRKSRWQNCAELRDGSPKIITMVHAHVDCDELLASCPNWIAAFVLACCKPSGQFTKNTGRILKQGQDFRVLSEKRSFQLLVNPRVAP